MKYLFNKYDIVDINTNINITNGVFDLLQVYNWMEKN